MNRQCLFHKYGHCNFGVKCKHYHATQLCNKENCNIQVCDKRHPRLCKYSNAYGRCKFNEFCSFSHSLENSQCDTTSITLRLDAVEKLVKEKDEVISTLQDEIKLIREENKLLEKKLSQTIVDVSKTVIDEAVKTIVQSFTQRQEEMEKVNIHQFDTIERNLAALSKLFQPTLGYSTITPMTPSHSTHVSKSVPNNRVHHGPSKTNSK